MGKHVAGNLIKLLIKADKHIKNARVAILGFTFKENCPDTRNTRVIDIISELGEYGVKPVIADPVANIEEAKREYGVHIVDIGELNNMDAVVIAVSHNEFLNMDICDFDKMFVRVENSGKVIVDVKGILDRDKMDSLNYQYWRL
jgi:UDP-N-acetyl-D-galactosamine dehydrogenase